MFNRNHRMWRNALMLGGLLVVAVVAVALFDVLRTLVHGFDLSFLRDAGGQVPPAGGVGAAGAGAAGAASGDPDREQLEADQRQYLKDHPQESPSDPPPSEWEQAKHTIIESILTGGHPR